jgi:hypothetical protein
MRRFRYVTGSLLVLWLWGFLAAPSAAPTYYSLADFQWYVRYADGSKQRLELLSQLSRQQILVVVLWSDPAERDRKRHHAQALLHKPPAGLPTFGQITPGPSSDHFATYILTAAADQSLQDVAGLLNTMQGLATFDYALPVLELSRGPAAPFIEFTVVFAASAAPKAISSFLQRQPVTVLGNSGPTYSLRLRPQATTNILAVLRAFEEATSLVNDVQPIWIDARGSPAEAAPSPPPIEARVTLDTGWDFPLVEVREPIIYHLRIEYSPQVHILPESVVPTALRRALTRVTTLPPELFEITENRKQTERLPGERIREHVEYMLRVSKPGTYRIPALQITYSLQNSRRTAQQFQSLPQQGYLLTVEAHLPIDAPTLPGDILIAPRWLRRPGPWLRPLAFGLLASGGLACVASFLFLKTPRQRHTPRKKPLSPRRLRQQYQIALQHLQDTIPAARGIDSSATRAWVHNCAVLLRRLLGEWAAAEPTLFEAGPGVSAAMILAHLQDAKSGQETFLAPTLELLQELDELATTPEPTLTLEEYHRFSESMQQTILLLTNNEASRVLRTPPGL